MSHLWQHPYVNVFKHFNLGSWKKSTKEGEVSSAMEKQLKGTVYRITGSIPAGNYIQLPKTSSQSLGLTGHYVYLLFRPIPSKYFVVHVDLATQDNLIVRVSFSNLFKEFKATSTWLQFPYLCNAAKGSVSGYASAGARDNSGPAPLSTRWTVLCLDMQYILSMYLNRKFSYMKNIKLCANMSVKNIFTSDSLYDPGLTVEEVKRAGGISQGLSPMPREMAFPLMKTDNWHDHYDLIRFPNDSSTKPFDSIQYSANHTALRGAPRPGSPRRVSPKRVDISKCVTDRVSMIHDLTHPKKQHGRKRTQVTRELPSVGVDNDVSIKQDEKGEVHIFAHPDEQVVVHRPEKGAGKVHVTYKRGEVHVFAFSGSKVAIHRPRQMGSRQKATKEVLIAGQSSKTLEPDPILKLKRIVGFGGATFKDAVWSSDGSMVVYPCHAIAVAMKVNNGHQRFFIGHTDKVSCISLNGNSTLLATGQTGQLSVIRLWNFRSGECLTMCKTHVHTLHCLSFSHSGNVLCGVGKDGHGKNMVVIWNTSRVSKSREVTVMAKAHTDVDILRMKISTFDDTRMVSCGRDNVRLWRVKEGSLRSAPVNLGEYHNMEFTDTCFEAGYHADKDPSERLVYACSRSGHIFEIDYQKLSIHNVRRLLPKVGKSKQEKQTFNSAGGISISTMCVNESFCVTGSDDGFLRLWPLNFAHVFLEAEHEGSVSAVDITADGLMILAGTAAGNLGILDVSSRGYTTIMRSHVGKILSLSIDPYRKHIATVAQDHTIRVWDSETLQQLYDFSAPQECPCTICYHPARQIFACGFESGTVRVFNVSNTSMLAEHKQHRGQVIGVAFSPNGDYLYSAGSLGSIALFDGSSNSYELIRLLGNTVARGDKFGPDALAVSPDGQHIAFVGPSEYTISVVNARSLDEVMRLDITHLNTVDNSRTFIDSAVKVHYGPDCLKHLLVTTSSNKLLKFNAKTGRLLAEVDHVHRSGCTSLVTSEDGRYLATAGDRVLKIWDYHMKLDINFQVFIGHSEDINKVLFTPDGEGFLSVGEALYLWDFLAIRSPSPTEPEGRNYTEKSWIQNGDMRSSSRKLPESSTDIPRRSPPRPARYESLTRIEDLSSIHHASDTEDLQSEVSEKEEILIGPDLHDNRPPPDNDSSDEEEVEVLPRAERLGESPQVKQHRRYQGARKSPVRGQKSPERAREGPSQLTCPNAHKHFIQRQKSHAMAQRRYTAPPNQAGLKLKSVIGYNGNGRSNMVWHPDTGLFVYTSGCVVIVEDLNTSSQKHLLGHVEEISTLALQNDCQVLASASGSFELTSSQICVWDLQQMVCMKVLSHHEYDVICLAYSRDDRFLISVGDYHDNTIVVWSTYNYSVLSSSTTAQPIHDLKWDPYTVNEFSSVGGNGTVLFWLLDETSAEVCLNVHEAQVPEELLQTHYMATDQVDFTCLEYAGDSTLYVGSSNGKVSAWDTRHNSCFMHWEADNSEIDYLVCRHGRLLTASVGHNVRLWSVVGIGEMRLPGDNHSMRSGGLAMEDEMNLDGAVSSLAFDDMMEMGIVGTNSGTLWYINWNERTSIRLVSGHSNKVMWVDMSGGSMDHFVTCAEDGSLRIWSLQQREQVLQFQVTEQSCTCLAIAPRVSDRISVTSNLNSQPVMAHARGTMRMPYVTGGYSDGTVRMFDVDKVEMILKMRPHAVSVTAISFSADGRMILSGGSDGLIAVSSPATGLTVRVITDHKGAPITNFDLTYSQGQDTGISSPLLWLATSTDRRVSVWSADWSKDFCELADWLTFPAPAYAPNGSVISKGDKAQYKQLPPSFARFSPDETDIIVYVGYGMQKQVNFYSMSQRKVVRTAALTHWGTCMDICPSGSLIAMVANERLVKLMDYYEGSFQDFIGHNDSVHVVKFSPDGRHLFTVAHSEIFIWEVAV